MTAHLRTPQADSDLEEIWRYVAGESGSYEIADRLIDSILDRFLLLCIRCGRFNLEPRYPHLFL